MHTPRARQIVLPLRLNRLVQLLPGGVQLVVCTIAQLRHLQAHHGHTQWHVSLVADVVQQLYQSAEAL
jgi:hypothetical protein